MITLLRSKNPTRAREIVSASEADLRAELSLKRQWDEIGKPYRPVRGSSYSTWNEVVNVLVADGTAVVSTASETSLLTGGIGWPGSPIYTLPANWFVGKVVRISASGRISNTVTPTLTIKLTYGAVGGTTLATTGALTTVSGLANDVWTYEAMLTCRSVGASGSLFATGFITGILGVAANINEFGSAGAASPAAVTVDLTTATTLQFTAQWGTSSASNTITLHQYVIEVSN